MIRFAPFLTVSVLLHGLLFMAGVPWIVQRTSAGSVNGIEECLFVEVVADHEQTASAPTPAAVDAAAATESRPTQDEGRQQELDEEVPEPEKEHEPKTTEDDETPAPPVLARSSPEPTDLFNSEEEQPELQELKEEDRKKKDVERDNERTQEATPESVASIPQVASRQTVWRAARGHDLTDFKAKVIAAIKKASYYPRGAAKKKERGKVVLRFRIWRDGHVDGIEIVHSSESKVLDETATAILQKAIDDFPSVPDFFQEQHLVYAVPIIFTGKTKLEE